MLQNSTQTRNHSLDALKIAAAIGIYCLHYTEQFPLNNVFLGKALVSYAYMLVELFFMISGYLMATKEDRIAQIPFSRFFFERTVRILPFCWIAMVLQYALNLWGTGTILNGMGLWSTVSNALFMPWILRDVFSIINAPCWYLVVLLLLYWIFWGVLHLTVRIGKNPVPIYVLLFICGVLARIGISPFNIITSAINRGLIAFFIGCLLFHFNKLFSGKKIAIIAFSILVGCATAVLLVPGLRDDIYMIVTAILFPALLLFCLNFRWLEDLLNHRWVEILSRSSFEIFVLNAPFITLHHRLFFLYIPDRIRGNLLVMLTSVAVLIALSVLCYFYVEKPLTVYFIRLLQKKHLLPTASENIQD